MIDQRNRQVTFGSAFGDFFRGFVDFRGYSSRAGHWFPVGTITAVFFILIAIIVSSTIARFNGISRRATNDLGYLLGGNVVNDSISSATTGVGLLVFVSIIMLVLAIPLTASFARRLRDVGFAVWGISILIALYYILTFYEVYLLTPVYSIVFLFVLMSLPPNAVETNSNSDFAKFFLRQTPEAQSYYAQFANSFGQTYYQGTPNQGYNPNQGNFTQNGQQPHQGHNPYQGQMNPGFAPNQGHQGYNPHNGQNPQGFAPNQGKMPNYGQNPQGFNPNQGIRPNNGQVPPQGFNPNQGVRPNNGQNPQGFAPNQGVRPNNGQVPPQGFNPNQGVRPNNGQNPQGIAPNQGVRPNNGQAQPQNFAQNQGHNPNQAPRPNNGQVPPQGFTQNQEVKPKEEPQAPVEKKDFTNKNKRFQKLNKQDEANFRKRR